MRPTPVPQMLLLSPSMISIGEARGVKWANQERFEDMVREAPESITHLSCRSPWGEGACNTFRSRTMSESESDSLGLSTTATFADALEVFALVGFSLVFPSPCSLLSFQHSVTLCPLKLQ